MTRFKNHMLALAAVSALAFSAPLAAQSADEQAPTGDDVATEVVDMPVEEPIETTAVEDGVDPVAVEDGVDPVPVEWVQRDGDDDLIMYSFMNAGMENPAEDVAARAAEQAASQAMDQVDAASTQAPLP